MTTRYRERRRRMIKRYDNMRMTRIEFLVGFVSLLDLHIILFFISPGKRNVLLFVIYYTLLTNEYSDIKFFIWIRLVSHTQAILIHPPSAVFNCSENNSYLVIQTFVVAPLPLFFNCLFEFCITFSVVVACVCIFIYFL